MPVVTNPADTITLSVDSQTIECQVVSHNLQWADPAAGDTTRTGCGDTVVIPADSTEVGTLDLTVFDDRVPSGFAVWTRQNHGVEADFVLVETYDNDGTPASIEYSGKVIVAAVPVKQEAYTKIETVDVSWSVTSFTTVAVVPTP
jgi:hypothetical protein